MAKVGSVGTRENLQPAQMMVEAGDEGRTAAELFYSLAA
jgi:hypothetical protein